MLSRCLIVLFVCSGAVAQNTLWLPGVFSDHMVLQRDAEPLLWGRATPGAKVRVVTTWDGADRSVNAADDGRFEVRLTTSSDPGPFEVHIETPGGGCVLRDVTLGEVWVCSGQSNMEWPLHATDTGADGARELVDPEVRWFVVPNVSSAVPLEDCDAQWEPSSRDMIAGRSAVAFWFAHELRKKLDCPIGLIQTDWGGTPVEAWTSEVPLRRFGAFAAQFEVVDQLRGDRSKLDAKFAADFAAFETVFERADPGSPVREGWHRPETKLDGWREATVPGHWENTELGRRDGLVWYRRSVDIPEAWAGKDLVVELGPIDDCDTTWFDGREIGRTDHYLKPRHYAIAGEHVRAGERVLAVRVHDTGGAGGFHGEPRSMRIRCPELDQSISLAGAWRVRPSAMARQLPRRPSKPAPWSHMPAGLFHGMIHPIVGYGIRGAIWYQGESNVGRGNQYRVLFPMMIRDWRAHWGREFPFYFVQIAPFAYDRDRGECAELREAQLFTMQTVPNTGMVVTTDVGDPRDIHPRDKRTVGERLALWALAKDYGVDGACCGPIYSGMKIDGRHIRVSFDHAEGLNAGSGKPNCFTIAGADREFVEAQARIEGDAVVVWSDEIASPVAVRMGWGAADQPVLRNGAGLPASPFRTDDWPMVGD